MASNPSSRKGRKRKQPKPPVVVTWREKMEMEREARRRRLDALSPMHSLNGASLAIAAAILLGLKDERHD